jgi:hypothetical protein
LILVNENAFGLKVIVSLFLLYDYSVNLDGILTPLPCPLEDGQTYDSIIISSVSSDSAIISIAA